MNTYRMIYECSFCGHELSVKFRVINLEKEQVLVAAISRCPVCMDNEFHEGKTVGSIDPHGFHEMGR